MGFIILLSLMLTCFVYGLFPLIYALTRTKPITKSKYNGLCFGVNVIGLVLFTILAGAASGGPYAVWTVVFSSVGIKILNGRGILVGKTPKKKASVTDPAPDEEVPAETNIPEEMEVSATPPIAETEETLEPETHEEPEATPIPEEAEEPEAAIAPETPEATDEKFASDDAEENYSIECGQLINNETKKGTKRGKYVAIIVLSVMFLIVVTVNIVRAVNVSGSNYDCPKSKANHMFSEWVIDEVATCVKTGTKHHTCVACGKSVSETIPVIACAFGEWVIDEAATCVKTGTKHQTCVACGKSVSETIPVTACAFGEWVIDEEATCVTKGAKHRICTVCGEKETEVIPVAPNAHNYAADWTSDDEKHWRVCQNEGCTAKADITAHIFDEWVIDVIDTCMQAGVRHHVCTVCYKSVSGNYSDSSAHNYATTWTSDDTYHWHVCQNSGCASIPDKTTHTFGEWIIDKAATCVSPGTRHHICEECNKSVSETYSDPNAHNYASAWAHDNANHWHKCQNSGCASLTDKAVHSFGEWVETKAPTCTKKGTERRDCSACSFYETRDLDAKGHIESGFVVDVAASIYSEGSQHTYCMECFSKIQTNVVIPQIVSQGLAYRTPSLSKVCTITGLGSCTDSEIGIPDTIDGYTVVGIAENAFNSCTSLTGIAIPSTVTSIGYGAFAYCPNLKSITIPDSVTTIGSLFSHCTSLTSVTFGENSQLTELSGFDCCTSLKSITIPNSVKTIGRQAFWGCTSLTSITIPDSVTTIDAYAFYDCTGLKSVDFGENSKLTTIRGMAFGNCTSLTSIILPDSVTNIAGSTFQNCTSLTSITIPDSVTTIGEAAFSNCFSLTSITFGGTKVQWNAISKGDLWNIETPTITVKCTDGTVTETYQY